MCSVHRQVGPRRGPTAQYSRNRSVYMAVAAVNWKGEGVRSAVNIQLLLSNGSRFGPPGDSTVLVGCVFTICILGLNGGSGKELVPMDCIDAGFKFVCMKHVWT